MANNFKTQLSNLANGVLFHITQKNIVLQHTNREYDSSFYENPVGIYNDTVEIITTMSMGPATKFTPGQQIEIKSYTEGSVTLKLDTIVDQSFLFNIKETEHNPGAILRATESAGVSVLDFCEIETLKAIYKEARIIATPNGGIQNQKDLAVIERFANDNMIPAHEVVVFINSATKEKLTSDTPIFAYSTDKSIFNDGVGRGNTDFENGNGKVTDLFGMPIYMSSKLTENYLNKYVLNEINEGTTYLDTATAKVSNGKLSLSVIENDAFVIKSGSVLSIGAGVIVKVAEDVTVEALTARDVLVKTTDEVASQAPGSNVTLIETSKFGNFVMSNKAVGFAMKALKVEDASIQAIALDTDSGISLRTTKAYNVNFKNVTLSVDAYIGVSILIKDKIAIF